MHGPTRPGQGRIPATAHGTGRQALPGGRGEVMMAVMALATAFTELLSVQHPIALAPMGGSAGGALAAAVSNGGGLGLLGGGGGDRDWLARELPILAAGTTRPWGVGFQSWAVDVGTVELALQFSPRAVMLSFGDPRAFAGLIRQAGAALIIQVTDLEEARQALDAGADIIVAQGTEAGGHSAWRGRSTLPFVPIVVDLAAPVPVLAAGGIADGRGVAAALALGAAGAWLGSAWLTTEEYALTSAMPAMRAALLAATSSDTVRSRIYSGKPARLLKNRWTQAWSEPGAPAPLPMPLQNLLVSGAHQRLMASGQPDVVPMPVGQIVGRLNDVRPVADVMADLLREADETLSRLDGLRAGAAQYPR
jgi:nitronate monooxygenase